MSRVFPVGSLHTHTHSKPRTQRAKRALEARSPKLTENTKSALFIRGGNTSGTVNSALRDLVESKLP